jgi:hypothetical protein
VLGLVVGTAIGGVCWRVGYEAASGPGPATLSEAAENFLTSYLATYYMGAIASGIPFVAWTANICAVVFAAAVIVPALQSKRAAKTALAMLLVLSLFTLWVEVDTSPAGIAFEVVKVLAGVATFGLDVTVSVVWCLIWVAATRAIGAELPESRAKMTPRQRAWVIGGISLLLLILFLAALNAA